MTCMDPNWMVANLPGALVNVGACHELVMAGSHKSWQAVQHAPASLASQLWQLMSVHERVMVGGHDMMLTSHGWL